MRVLVLVLESDPMFRRYLCRALGVLGHEVEADGGWTGLLGAAAARAPDAVVFELDAAEDAVLRVCSALSRARPGVRLVAIVDGPHAAEKARRAGLRGVLVKPFGLLQLRGALPSF